MSDNQVKYFPYLHLKLRELKLIPLLSFLLLMCEGAFAQDVHWTQFNDNPVFLNPANSGNFKGSGRFVANYRDQWRSVTKPFQTFSCSYDTRLKNRDFGLGVLLFNDQAGDGKFKTIELEVNPSYKIPLNQDSTHVLYTGLQLAFNHRQFNFSKFYFDEQFNGQVYDPSLPITEALITQKKNSFSIGAGAVYQYRKIKKTVIHVGLSAFNINQPNQGFYGTTVHRDLRLNLYTKVVRKVSDKLDVIPSFMFQKQGTYRELVLGGIAKYTLKNEEKDYKALYGGFYFRTKDAIFFNLGMDYQKWYVGISYDLNVSSLKPASAGRGGLEFSMRYIFQRFKPKQIQHRICPEFI